ncbi:hypothetical protein GCM10009716_39930 [Streptomyces sodiiphilus]|uniref:Uncharacterized protein n=1 Tax=Streptomyces sodiiphilus TaxID=226217 RepID=A0ABP5B2C1_9ACTN
MRELLYLSQPKLDAFMPRGGNIALQAAELGVDVAVINARLEAGTSDDNGHDLRARFHKVLKHIDRQAGDIHDRHLAPGDWLRFDLRMGYGTAHEDSALPNVKDDVVLFGGAAPQTDSDRPVEVLLCGSACHLMDRCAPAGGGAGNSRMGSGTRWMYEMIHLLNTCDERGDSHLLREVVAPEHRDWSINDPEQVGHWVYRVIDRHHPRHQRQRLAGLARVVMHLDDTRWMSRLIVATPLYVEYGSFTPIRSWHRRWGNRRPLQSTVAAS